MKHHPHLYYAGRHGAWARCMCGWSSRYAYTRVTGAHWAFGLHLLGRVEPGWKRVKGN